MSGFTIVVKLDTDEFTVTRVSRLIKDALAPLEAATFTFDESQFRAHWKPLMETPMVSVPVMEHVYRDQNPHKRR